MAAPEVRAGEKIKVLLVDDHPVVCEGLHALISAEPDLTVVGQAETGEAAVAAYFELRPAVVVMDLLLPDINGSEAIRRIYAKSPSARIVVLTSAEGDEEIYRALEAGARGFLFKDMARRELITAIRAVHGGSRYVPARVGTRMAENFPRPELTGREIEVLELLAAGLRNKEIAYKLDLSEATVNVHIKHAIEKLKASGRTHAVTVALKRGFIKI